MARNKKLSRRPVGIAISEINIAATKPDDDAHSLRERAMLVRCPMGTWAPSVQDRAVTAKVLNDHGARSDSGTFTKRRMHRDVLKRIRNAVSSARAFHKQATLPWGDSGARLLPVTSFFEYKRKMTGFEQEFSIAVDEFIGHYDKHVKEQRERLGALWKAADYPPPEIVRAQYRFAVIVEPIPTSDDFRVALSKGESDEIKKQYDAEVKVRMKDAVQDVFTNVQEAIVELRDKLADPNASVKAASFGSLKKLVASLPNLNSVVRDPAIKQLGDAIAQELLSMSSEAAHSTQVRGSARAKADAILAALKPLQSNWQPKESS